MQQFSLAPNHPVLNYPNKITSTDFEGWTRTRIVLSNEFDKAFTPILSSMTKEKVQKRSIIGCPLWKRILYLYRFKFIQRIARRSFWCISIANMISLKTPKQAYFKNKTITQIIWKQKKQNWKKLYMVLV
jgi:hypothetical protein